MTEPSHPMPWSGTAALLPRGELQLVQDGGHVPWFDDPRLVASRVRRFLVQPGRPA